MSVIPEYQVDSPKAKTDDTSGLYLTQYQDFTSAFNVTAGTPIVFAANGSPSGAGGVWLIPKFARYVRIHGLTGGNPIPMFTSNSNTPSQAAVNGGSMQAVSGISEWFGLPLTAARSFILDIVSSGNVLVAFGW